MKIPHARAAYFQVRSVQHVVESVRVLTGSRGFLSTKSASPILRPRPPPPPLDLASSLKLTAVVVVSGPSVLAELSMSGGTAGDAAVTTGMSRIPTSILGPWSTRWPPVGAGDEGGVAREAGGPTGGPTGVPTGVPMGGPTGGRDQLLVGDNTCSVRRPTSSCFSSERRLNVVLSRAASRTEGSIGGSGVENSAPALPGPAGAAEDSDSVSLRRRPPFPRLRLCFRCRIRSSSLLSP